MEVVKRSGTQAEMESEEAILKSVSQTQGDSQDSGRQEVSERRQIMDPATKMWIVQNIVLINDV